MKKRICKVAISALAIGAVLAGCGGSSHSADASYAAEAAVDEVGYSDYSNDYYYEDEEYYYDDDVYEAKSTTADTASGDEALTDEEIASASSNRKLIKTVNLNVETRDFDECVNTIQNKIDQLGGYAESVDISGKSYEYTSDRNAYIVARIPQEKLDQFVNSVEDNTNITSRSESAEDVTLSYADTQARRDSLRVEQKRLNELLEQADSLETIIALESRLTEVRYELESYESRLRAMDNQVTYSTVYLSINEVKEYKPAPIEDPTLGERIAEAFADSCEAALETIQDFIVGFVAAIPILLVLIVILGIVGLIIFAIVRLIMYIVKKSTKNKKPAKKTVYAKPVESKEEAKAVAVADVVTEKAEENKESENDIK